MPRATPILTDFTAGEIAPFLYAQTSQPVFYKGASQMLNFMPRKQGGFRKRPGTLFIGHTNGDTAATLFSIKINANLSYVLEFTLNKIRFWKFTNGVLTYVTGQDATTTYTLAECSQLQFAWLAPDLFIAHQNHPPARIRWATGDVFTYSNLTFVTTSYTFTANTVSGSPTLTNLSNTNLPIATQSGLWLLTGTGIPASTYLTAVYPSATPSQTIAALSATMNNNATASNTGVTLTLTEQPVPFQSSNNYPRCVCAAFSRVWWANTVTNPQTLWATIVNVWDDSDPGGTSGKMNMNLFEGTIYNNQVMITDSSGNPTTNPPSYTNQQATQNSIADSDGMQLTLSEATSEILWISPGQDLIIGLADGEMVVPAASTANTVYALLSSKIGSQAIQGEQLTDGIVFVKLSGQAVYELMWQSVYVPRVPPRDLTFFSSHLFVGNAALQFEYSQAPDMMMWFPRADGTIAAMIYDPTYGVMGWWQLKTTTGHTINSVAVCTGPSGDVLFMSTTRGSYCYIEQQTSPDWTDVRTAIYMDAATYKYNAVAFSTITVDSSFNGLTLAVVADGVYVGTAVPSAGTLTIPGGISANYCTVGFLMQTPTMKTMPISAGAQYGDVLRRKGSPYIRIQFYNAMDCQAMMDGLPAQTVNFQGNLTAMQQPNPTPYTGYDRVPIDVDLNEIVILDIQSANPLPCEVTALVPEIDVEIIQ